MKKQIIIGIILLVLIFLGGIWFLIQNNNSSQQPAEQIVTPQNTNQEVITADATDSSILLAEVKEFTIEGQNFKLTPAEIKVKQGDKVQITFKNTGGFHDFVIPDLNIKTKQIQTSSEETVEFIAEKAGTFEFYCSVGNHRAQGMKGTLTVE